MTATQGKPAGERNCVSEGAGSQGRPRPLPESLWSRGRAGFEHPWRVRRGTSGCGSRGRGSALLGHGQLRRGTAGASLRSPPCPAASAPLGVSLPDSGPPASFSFHPLFHSVLPVPTPAPIGAFHPDPGVGRALLFPVPNLVSASSCLSHHDPGLAPSRPEAFALISPGWGFHAFPGPTFLIARGLPRLSRL